MTAGVGALGVDAPKSASLSGGALSTGDGRKWCFHRSDCGRVLCHQAAPQHGIDEETGDL